MQVPGTGRKADELLGCPEPPLLMCGGNSDDVCLWPAILIKKNNPERK